MRAWLAEWKTRKTLPSLWVTYWLKLLGKINKVCIERQDFDSLRACHLQAHLNPRPFHSDATATNSKGKNSSRAFVRLGNVATLAPNGRVNLPQADLRGSEYPKTRSGSRTYKIVAQDTKHHFFKSLKNINFLGAQWLLFSPASYEPLSLECSSGAYGSCDKAKERSVPWLKVLCDRW